MAVIGLAAGAGMAKAATPPIRLRRFIGFSLYTKSRPNAARIERGGGRLRTWSVFLLAGSLLAMAALKASAPMALVILNATSAPPGRLPDGWQLKVNRGTPDLA